MSGYHWCNIFFIPFTEEFLKGIPAEKPTGVVTKMGQELECIIMCKSANSFTGD